MSSRFSAGALTALAALASKQMATFLYRCPGTGHNVQGFVADDPNEDERSEDYFQGVVCRACGALHWVNPKTGKVLGTDEE